MWNQLPSLARLAISGVGAFLVYAGIKHLNKKRVFISFAMEDKSVRDLLVGQACNKNTPFEFIDMSVQDAWDNAWKTQCRERIKTCHGVIVLVSKNTLRADGACWEIKCAKQENLPIMAMYINKEAKGCQLPPELKGLYVYKWTWTNINNFLNKLKEEIEEEDQYV